MALNIEEYSPKTREVMFLCVTAVVALLMGLLFANHMRTRADAAIAFFTAARPGISEEDLFRLLPVGIGVPEDPHTQGSEVLRFQWPCSHRPMDYIEVSFDRGVVNSAALVTADAKIGQDRVVAYLAGVRESWFVHAVDMIFIVLTLELIALTLFWVYHFVIQHKNCRGLLKLALIALVLLAVIPARVPLILFTQSSEASRAVWNSGAEVNGISHRPE